MHNIERSAFRHCAYVGYGGGMVWYITRAGRAWRATTASWTNPREFTAPRLRDVSARLDAMPGNK